MNKSSMYSIPWITTAIAVSVGIYVTKSAAPLLAMVLPAMLVNSSKEEK